MSNFDILRALDYYRDLPHQKAAFKLLWQSSSEKTKAEVIALYRSNSAETKQEPASVLVKPTPRQTIKLPGGKTVGLDDPIIPNGHFSWREAINSDLRRVPKDKSVVGNIIRIATELETVRGWFQDRPVKVTSWFRPPAINRAVGGVSNSRHILGDAVDLSVPSLDPMFVEQKLLQLWGDRGGCGLGQKKQRGFTHLDLRNYRAVWDY